MTTRTLEQIRAALPTHIMLTPGLHKSQNGDEIGVAQKNGSVVWIAPMFDGRYEWVFERPDGGRDYVVLQTAIDDKIIWRRPIPPHILDNQAWWLYVQQLIGKNFNVYTWVQYTNYMHPMYKKVLSKIGGVGMCTQRNEEGRLYDKWLLEQMEDV